MYEEGSLKLALQEINMAKSVVRNVPEPKSFDELEALLEDDFEFYVVSRKYKKLSLGEPFLYITKDNEIYASVWTGNKYDVPDNVKKIVVLGKLSGAWSSWGGDVVLGDKVGGDKIGYGNISNASGVAIGSGATVVIKR